MAATRNDSALDSGAILVTGGAGYIGSHTVRSLRGAGHTVVVLDTLELGRKEAVLGAPLVVGDVADHDLVVATCKQYNVKQLVHFAAYKSVGESMHEPGKYFRNNVAGTAALLEACLAAGVQQVVFSSSCSVYGTPSTMPVSEDSPLGPESVYAQSKAMVEQILHWYAVTGRLRYVSLRYFNAAGASFDARIGEDWSTSHNLIPLVMKAALLDGHRLQVFGDDYDTPDGTCIRDYVHVEDLASAHVKSLDYLRDRGESVELNVGTGTGSSVFQVLRAAESVTSRAIPHEIVARRVGDPVAVYAAPAHAQRVLNWSAQYDLDAIVRTAYVWHSRQLERSA